MIQQGIEGRDSKFLRHDGSVPLSGTWDAGGFAVQAFRIMADSGGLIIFGDYPGQLRFVNNGLEIIEILGVSNNQAELHLKNLRVGDLAGVGNRNVIADVNGDLSAP